MVPSRSKNLSSHFLAFLPFMTSQTSFTLFSPRAKDVLQAMKCGSLRHQDLFVALDPECGFAIWGFPRFI